MRPTNLHHSHKSEIDLASKMQSLDVRNSSGFSNNSVNSKREAFRNKLRGKFIYF